MKERIKKTFNRSKNWERKEKKRKKNNEKIRKTAINSMVDFNNFIRDDVVEPGQKDRLI